MNLDDFIDNVFLRFPPKINDVKPIEIWFNEYRQLLQSNKIYNYREAYDDLIKNYKYATLPTVNTLLSYLNSHILNRGDGALSEIKRIKLTPKFNIESESDEFKNRIRAKLQAIGISSKLKALQE